MKDISHVEIRWIIKEWDNISDTLCEVIGSGSALILRYMGMGIGKGFAKSIKEYCPNLQESLRFLSKYFDQRTLGNLIFVDVNEKLSGRLIIQKTSLRSPYSRFILYGIIAGFLEEISEKRISIKEARNNFPIELEAILFGGDRKSS